MLREEKEMAMGVAKSHQCLSLVKLRTINKMLTLRRGWSSRKMRQGWFHERVGEIVHGWKMKCWC